MPEAVYFLCFLTSSGCAVALLHAFVKRRAKILFWSAICFVGLALNNALLFADLVLYRSIDLSVLRAAVSAAAMLTLIAGLIWDVD